MATTGVPGAKHARAGREYRSGQLRPRHDADAVRRRVALLLGLGGASLVGGLLYGSLVFSGGEGVPKGVTVLGVDIGGLSYSQAVETLERRVGPTSVAPVTLTSSDAKTVDLDPTVAGLHFDAVATVDRAMRPAWSPVDLIKQIMGGTEVDPVVTVDQSALADSIAQVVSVIDTPAVEPSVSFDGTRPTLTPGSTGTQTDQQALAAIVSKNYLVSTTPIEIPVDVLQPSVSQADAQTFVNGPATTATSAAVTVQAGTSSQQIWPSVLADAASVDVVDGHLELSFDGAKLHESLRTGLTTIEQPGSDATFKIIAGRPVVVPAVAGHEIDESTLASVVLGAALSNDNRSATVDLIDHQPTLTTEEATSLGVTEQLSTFTQHFPTAPYRVQNIGQAAKYVSGTVLRPGETFSMNDTIKERTAENGYTEGLVVGEGGVFDKAMGGGVSTATTAVWTAAFFAGLERVSTTAHSIYISRYQPGLEATVNYGVFDMQFKNNMDNGVFITADLTTGVDDSSITVTIWGTKVYDEVKADPGPRHDIKPNTTLYDASSTCLGQEGSEGFTIDVDRVFIKDGAEVGRETIETVYKPSPKVICGRAPVVPTAAGQAAAADPSAPSDQVAPSGEADALPVTGVGDNPAESGKPVAQ